MVWDLYYGWLKEQQNKSGGNRKHEAAYELIWFRIWIVVGWKTGKTKVEATTTGGCVKTLALWNPDCGWLGPFTAAQFFIKTRGAA